jgi:hypothetical protein
MIWGQLSSRVYDFFASDLNGAAFDLASGI